MLIVYNLKQLYAIINILISILYRLYSSFNEYKRGFSLSAVDIETGEVVLLTDKNTPMEHLDKAVIASASVPGFFPPTEIGGRLLVDGMTAWNTNV